MNLLCQDVHIHNFTLEGGRGRRLLWDLWQRKQLNENLYFDQLRQPEPRFIHLQCQFISNSLSLSIHQKSFEIIYKAPGNTDVK